MGQSPLENTKTFLEPLDGVFISEFLDANGAAVGTLYHFGISLSL